VFGRIGATIEVLIDKTEPGYVHVVLEVRDDLKV
jgi:hypothetical protein